MLQMESARDGGEHGFAARVGAPKAELPTGVNGPEIEWLNCNNMWADCHRWATNCSDTSRWITVPARKARESQTNASGVCPGLYLNRPTGRCAIPVAQSAPDRRAGH